MQDTSWIFLCLTHCSPVLLFYTASKYQKTFRFSDVFKGYRKATTGCNGLKIMLHCSSFIYQYNRLSETQFEKKLWKTQQVNVILTCLKWSEKKDLMRTILFKRLNKRLKLYYFLHIKCFNNFHHLPNYTSLKCILIFNA